VITDGSPPDDRRGVGELSDELVDGAGVNAIVKLSSQSAVPAFDQVDDVHHQHERDRDVDVAVIARMHQSSVLTGDAIDVQLTPGECCQTAGYEEAEYEALPVTAPAQRPTERQACRLLLQHKTFQETCHFVFNPR